MEIQKPNDMFVAVIQKPDLNVFDLSKSDILPDNTQLLSLDKYKTLDKVQSLFKTESGAFDEGAFTAAYAKAATLYQELSSDKSLASALEYDPMDFTAPKNAKKMDVNPIAKVDYNPFKSLYSQTGVNSIDSSDLSLRELAQQNKIFDVSTNKWLDKSANDLGLFGSLFGETLVYAQWDSDGQSLDPVTKRLVSHKKGDWKINEDGNLYIETLGNREIYGKQIVNPKDLLTTDGSSFNKIDFFDSDGKDKSVVGTTMKLATEIAPFLIPGVGVWYGGFKMALGLASVLPTFYKAGEGLFLGDSKDGVETGMWKMMNSVEGYTSKFTDRSLSEEAQKSMWNYEQLGSMVSDVFSQIYEQRAAASLSKLFYKVNDVEHLDKLKSLTDDAMKSAVYAGKITSKEQAEKIASRAFTKAYEASAANSKRSQLAKALNLGYMAMTQSASVYGEALGAGYDRRTAGFTALLAASGQYALMSNNQMGNWFLDKTVGYSENESKAAIKKIANSLLQESKEASEKFTVNPAIGKAKFGEIFTKFKNKLQNTFIEPVLESEFAENIMKRSVIEGVEEVTEQAAIDAAKGITDFASSMGWTNKQGSFGGFSNVFSKKGLENYLANFIGGAIGGPMFELERSVISPWLSGNHVSLDTKLQVYDLVSTGRTNELLKEIENRKSKFGSTTLSPIISEINGEQIYLPVDVLSQADVIANNVTEYVKLIDKIINTENLTNSNEDIIKKSIIDQLYINDITKSGVDKFIQSDVKELGFSIIEISNQLKQLSEEESGTKSSELTSLLNQKRQEYTDIITGLKSEYYHGLALFTLNQNLHNAFINTTIDEYVKEVHNKDFYKLNDAEKEEYRKEFDELKSNSEGNLKTKMKNMYNMFLKMNESFSKSLKDYDADGYASVRSGFFKMFHTLGTSEDGTVNYIKGLERLNEVNNTLIKNGFPKLGLDTQTEISVGKFLVENGFVQQNLDEAKKSEISSKYKELIRTHIDPNNELSDEEFVELSKQTEAFNTVAAKIKEQVPEYAELSLENFLTLLSQGTLDNGDETLTLNLSNEEKQFISSRFNDFLQLAKQYSLLNELINKVGITGELTEEELASVGIAPIYAADGSLDIQASTQSLVEALNEVSTTYESVKGIKVDDLEDVELGNLLKQFEEETNVWEDLSDDKKEGVANYIDNSGIPSNFLNAETLQEILTKYNSETTKNLEKMQSELMKLDESEVIDEEQKMLKFSEIESFKTSIVGIRITPVSDIEISAKRALILKYAEDLMNANLDFDNEIIREIQIDYEHVKDKVTDLENDGMADTEEYDALYETRKKLEDILEYAEQHNKLNSLYAKLREYEIEIFGFEGPISFFEVLQDNIDFLGNNVEVKSDFIRSDVQLAQIKKARYVIKAIKSVVSAMSSTKWGVDNLYGMNIMLNKALEKEGLAPTYELLDSQATFTIIKDLNLIESKLDYFENLAENNVISIIDGDTKIRESFTKNINSQYLDTLNSTSLINLKVNGKTLFTSDDLEKFASIQDEELKMIEIEDTFYTRFHELEGDVSKNLDSLFSAFLMSGKEIESITSLLSSRDSNMSQDFDKLEKLDWFNWIHTLLSSNSKNFYIEYKNNIEKELSLQDNKKAPLFVQQLALRQVIGYVENKSIMSHAAKFLTENIEESVSNPSKDEMVKLISDKISLDTSTFRIENIIAIKGSGGTGKSSVLANWLLRYLQSSNILGKPFNVIAVAPTESTLEILNKEIKGSLDISIKNKLISEIWAKYINLDGLTKLENLITILEENEITDKQESVDKVNGLIDSDYFVAGLGNGAILIREKFFEDFMNKQSSDSLDVIIGDEMSKFTTLDWQLLNKLSASGKIYTILLGDELQNGVKIGENLFSMDNITVGTTIKMRNPIRSRNDLKNINNVTLENYVRDVKWNLLHKQGTIPQLTLKYNDKEGSFLTGDKLVSDISETDLAKLDPNKEIVVITDTGKMSADLSAKLKKVFGNKTIEVLPLDVQGREFEQVIIDANISNKKDPYTESRNLYTLLTRAKEVTLAKVNTSLDYINEVKISSKASSISPELVLRALKTRLEYINSLNLETNDLEIKSIPLEDEVKINEEELAEEIVDSEPVETPTPFEDSDKKPEESKPSTPKDKDNMLGYSFYNNLGLYLDENSKVSPIQEYLNYKITNNVTDPTKEISWNTLLDRLKPHISGTDLFMIKQFNYDGYTVQQIINEYVEFKNKILFTKNVDSNLFGNIVKAEKTWVLKKIRSASNNRNISSFGKLVNNEIVNNDIYAIGVYATIGGEKVFITLAVTPDVNNQKVKDAINVDTLIDIYKQVSDAPNSELPINKAEVKTLGLPYFPLHDGVDNLGRKNKIQSIEYDQITNIFPGAEVYENKVRVFWGDTDFIKKEFETFSGYTITDINTLNNMRFRPYIILNYVKGGVGFSRIILLNTKKRTASEFWHQFKEVASIPVTSDESVVRKTHHLISKYRAWEVFFNYVKFLKAKGTAEEFRKDLLLNFMGINQNNPITWEFFAETINSIFEFDFDPNDNDFSNEFKKWISSDVTLEMIAKDKSRLTKSIEYHWGNILHYVYDVSSNYDMDEFMDSIKTREIYYNPTIKSLGSDKEGSGYGYLDDSEKEHYDVNVAIEPNRLIINMPKLLKTAAPSSNKVTPSKTVVKTESKIVKLININNKFEFTVNIDTSNWGLDPEMISKYLEAMDRSLSNFINKNFDKNDPDHMAVFSTNPEYSMKFPDEFDGEYGENVLDYIQQKIYNSGSYIMKDNEVHVSSKYINDFGATQNTDFTCKIS